MEQQRWNGDAHPGGRGNECFRNGRCHRREPSISPPRRRGQRLGGFRGEALNRRPTDGRLGPSFTAVEICWITETAVKLLVDEPVAKPDSSMNAMRRLAHPPRPPALRWLKTPESREDTVASPPIDRPFPSDVLR